MELPSYCWWKLLAERAVEINAEVLAHFWTENNLWLYLWAGIKWFNSYQSLHESLDLLDFQLPNFRRKKSRLGNLANWNNLSVNGTKFINFIHFRKKSNDTCFHCPLIFRLFCYFWIWRRCVKQLQSELKSELWALHSKWIHCPSYSTSPNIGTKCTCLSVLLLFVLKCLANALNKYFEQMLLFDPPSARWK